MQKTNLAPAGRIVLPLFVLALAALVYGLYGFDGVLLRDYAIYLYGGQGVAEGIPPYASVFDHKGPLASIIAGAGVMLSQQVGWEEVYAVRLVFFASGCLTVVAVYLLGKSVFRSQAAGFLGALTFLGFYGFAESVASGPEPKTPMILFETLSLLLTVRKRWFWAGLCGSLAFLVWQPMGVFSFVTFVLAATRPKGERYGAALRALAGIAVPLVITVAYFYYHDALGDFLDGFVLFNVLYLVRSPAGIAWQAGTIIGVAASTYSTMLIPIFIGLATIVRLYFLRPFQYSFAPILLSLPGPLLWSLLDFQLTDDFFVFLPYAAIGFGAFLVFVTRGIKTPRLSVALLSALLLAVALGNTLEEVNADSAYQIKGTDVDLNQQREGALEIRDRLGEDARLASIGSPQVLVFLHQKNPNPYLWMTAGVDRRIDARTPGGFEAWIRELEASDPDAISFFGEGQSLFPTSNLTSEHRRELKSWLYTRYRAEKIGPWWLYVKNPPTSEANRTASIQS
jgi:hypothetical protein